MDKLTNFPRLPRYVIYPKDIQVLTGRSKSTAWRYLQKILAHFKKKRGQLITYQEFCQYAGVEEKVVVEHLKKCG